MTTEPMPRSDASVNTKFCKFCGSKIPFDAVICTSCGRQVELIAAREPQIIINNSNASTNTNTNTNTNVNGAYAGRNPRSKWVALFLCLFTVCGHKFYEGKPVLGLIYLFTMGLFGIGWFVDLIVLLLRPNPYYV